MVMVAAFALISCESTRQAQVHETSSLEWDSVVGRMTTTQAISQYGQPQEIIDYGDGRKGYVYVHTKLDEGSGPVMFNTSNPQNITSYRAGSPQVRKIQNVLVFGASGVLESVQQR